MSSLIVEVCEIESIRIHPNADRVEVATVKGWECVVPKDQFRVADRVIYFPPDTVITEELAEKFGITNYVSELPKNSDWTRPLGRRIRAKRFRGEQSFGFITKPDDPSWEVGFSVADHYGVTKYEPIVRDGDGNQAPDLPTFHRYTDIDTRTSRTSRISPMRSRKAKRLLSPRRSTERIRAWVMSGRMKNRAGFTLPDLGPRARSLQRMGKQQASTGIR